MAFASHTLPLTTAAAAASNTAFDGTGNIKDIVPVHATLTRKVLEIKISAREETTAQMLRLYIYNNADAAYIPHSEIPVTAVTTPGATTQRWSTTIRPVNMTLGKDDKLAISAHKIGVSPIDEFYVVAEVEEV